MTRGGVTLWIRPGQAESADAQRFLAANGFRPDAVRDLAAQPPTEGEWLHLARGLGDLWPLVDARHPDYATLLPRGREDSDDAALRQLLTEHPHLLRAPILLTPKGALAGFRERQWSSFLGVGADLRGL